MSTDDARTRLRYQVEELFVFRRKYIFQPATLNCQSPPLGAERSAMGSRVNPPRHPANDSEPCRSEQVRNSRCLFSTIDAAPSRADNGYRQAVGSCKFSLDIQHRRRVIDCLKCMRVTLVFGVDDAHTKLVCKSNLPVDIELVSRGVYLLCFFVPNLFYLHQLVHRSFKRSLDRAEPFDNSMKQCWTYPVGSDQPQPLTDIRRML